MGKRDRNSVDLHLERLDRYMQRQAKKAGPAAKGRWEFSAGRYPDGVTDICPRCRQYAQVKRDTNGLWCCTDCYQGAA